MAEYDISVIVPIYNAEKYLEQCIESILAQTIPGIQLVLVNDGATDGSPAIIERYAREHDGITVVNQENKGLAGARIAGLKAARGRWIGWVDADDFVEPDMYRKLWDLAQREGADYVYCDYSFHPGKVATKEKWFKPYEGRLDWRYIDRNTQCWNTLTLRTLIDEARLEELYERYGEYSWIAVMLHSEKTAFTREELYHYRVGEVTMSGGTFKGKTAHFRKGAEISSELQGMIRGTPWEQDLREYFEYRYIYTLLQLEIVAAVNDSREDYAWAASELKRLHFRRNPLTRTILDENHGRLKSLVMRRGIPMGYQPARLITKAIL